MTTTTRQRMISSLISMFKAEHGSTPQWLFDLHHRATDAELLARLGKWQTNYQAHYNRHGLYVM